MMFSRMKTFLLPIVLLGVALAGAASPSQQNVDLEAAQQAFERSDYSKAIQLLQVLAAKDPKNGEVHLLLAKSYFEMEQRDAAVNSAERAVAIEPQNSIYHEWLGRAYGEKADHASWFSAVGLAKKTRKEFEKAVELDEKNYSAMQELIEFDCAAPGIVGGGEDKAKPEIEKLSGLDVSEGHYAAGNCRRQKKDFEAADAEFEKSLRSSPKTTDTVYDIGDYAVKRAKAELLLEVAITGERVNPRDPRGKFYRAAALVLNKEKPDQAERLLREYAKVAPTRNAYPRPAAAHVWLGKLFENENKNDAAQKEYEAALKLDPKNKMAQEAVKRMKKG
jgi:tetratricopeptide (TPR) repeat protein